MAIATAELAWGTGRRPYPVEHARPGAGRRPAAAVRRARARRLLTTLFVATAVLVAIVALSPAAISSPEPSPPATVVVAPGDTVWEIAVSVTPPGGSTHEMAARIMAANDVDPLTLQPGTVLVIPSD